MSSSSSDSSDWEDIEVIVANDGADAASSSPLVAPQASNKEQQVRLLLEYGTANPLDLDDEQNNTSNKATKNQSSKTKWSSPLALLTSIPSRVRSLALIGSHLHGKSTLARDLIGRRNRLLPSAAYDKERGLTTQMYVQSSILTGCSNGTNASTLLNVIDTPGHSNFAAEVHPSFLLAESVALVVDAVEGVTTMTEQLLDSAVAEKVPLFLVVSKIDRIMIELRIPPQDAYKKLKHIVDSVNVLLETRSAPLVSPCHGTVVFLSSDYSSAFSIPLVARRYQEQFGPSVKISWLSSQLWGPISFDSTTRKFNKIDSKTAAATNNANKKPSFVSFILEPLYKAMLSGLKQQQNQNTSSGGKDVTISKLIRQSISNLFGSYKINLAECLFQAMNESLIRLEKNNNNSSFSSASYVKNLLQTSFGMPKQQTGHTSHLRGLEAANASMIANIEEGMTEIKKENNNNTNNSSSSLSRPYGVIAGKTRLLFISSSSRNTTSSNAFGGINNNSGNVSRVFAVMKLVSGILDIDDDENNNNNKQVKIYQGPDSELLSVSPKMMCLMKNHDELIPVRKVAAGSVVLIDFEMENPEYDAEEAAAKDDANINKRDVNEKSINNKKMISITSTLTTPCLMIPEVSSENLENNSNNNIELLPVSDTSARTSSKKGIFSTLSKLSVQPANIKDLSKLVDTVARITTERQGVTFSQENELVLAGIGEVQLDSVLFDIRRSVPIRTTAPFTSFCETVAANPFGVLRRHASEDVAFTAFATPMNRETENFVSKGGFSSSSSSGVLSRQQTLNMLRADCGWDLVDCDTLIDVVGSNEANDGCLLFCDWKKSSVFENNSSSVSQQHQQRNQQDFNINRWMTSSIASVLQHGPLCGEPVRGVRLNFVDRLTADGVMPSQASVSSCARALTLKTLLSAAPRLMEPVMNVDITLPTSRVDEVSEMLRKRRGAVLKEHPIPASTWSVLQGMIPLADSFGFETAVRVSTQGEAFPMMMFKEWQVVPGDPLDASLRVSPYESASGVHLARDFVMKTRKRKGLSDAIPLL